MQWQDSHNSISLTATVERWGTEFDVHWTFKNKPETAHYKRRVVGPNGEVCRDEGVEPENVPREVRAEFEGRLRDMVKHT